MSGLGKIAKQQEERREKVDEQGSHDAFRMRIAAQQFLKHHGPLLRSYVRAGGVSTEIVAPGAFEERARAARALAIAITAKVLNKPGDQVTMSEARHFRLEAAEVVAQAWDAGIEIDTETFAAGVASAIALADDAYDNETINWSQMSPTGSATITAAGISMSLAQSVDLYDFRVGKKLMLSTLTAAVVEATREAVGLITNEQSTDEDRRSLSQTTMRSFTTILGQIYDQHARLALETLISMPETKRRTWLRQQQPLETILGEFRTWTADISEVAAAAARETVTNSRTPSQKL